MAKRRKQPKRNLLAGARVYLSGPMDFVASREEEMKFGWRTRVGAFLQARGCIVFDPWQKPGVRGYADYGREGVDTTEIRNSWTFEDSHKHARARSKISGKFWETLHIDLRMVDTCDFVIAYCPTNIYSVGTPHEIVLCRQQRKPVLFVSPPVRFPTLTQLETHLAAQGDSKAQALVEKLKNELPVKPNEKAIPSLWYMPLVGSENFFDGFGFDAYRRQYRWPKTGPLDVREKAHKPVRPLLPFLETVMSRLPKKWNGWIKRYVRNDDWLLWDLHPEGRGGSVVGARGHARITPKP